MSEDRRSILTMLSEGKITPDEAERLLAALERDPAQALPGADGPRGPGDNRPPPKYLRVAVDTEDGHGGPTKVNVRVPMQLLRAGVRLSSIIPPEARERVNDAMRRKGHVNFDLKELRPENLEELIEQLNDLTVDVDQDRTRVRIFCE
jgi:polyhydroxyalkanoate synthesis regulator phasin